MTDDELGIAWWNSLTERERMRWSCLAGNTGRAKDAWEVFKAFGDYEKVKALSNGDCK